MNSTKYHSVINSEKFPVLKSAANISNRKRTLLKLHTSHDEELHTMINVLKKGTYIQPHRHMIQTEDGKTIRKGESFLALEGEGNIILFDEPGKITDVIRLKESEKTMVWIPAEIYHTIVATTDYFIIFENKTGPWKEFEDKNFHTAFPSEEEHHEQFVMVWENL
jgi:cupin fold WbuC family metalloprotein